MTHKKSRGNLVIPLLLLITGIATLIPNEAASKPSMLGYKALCSFVPISTLILFALALLAFRGWMKKPTK